MSTSTNFMGEDYPYHKYIRTPSQIGMNEDGTIPQLGRNINGFVEYTKLLVTGDSSASATRKALGNKYFLKTGATCKAKDTCNGTECTETDRYIYVNNIPSGNIPLVSSGMGVKFTNFRGLIPGAMENLNVLNPMGIFRAFEDGASPECQKITMETIDINNNSRTESHYVTISDIESMDPCWFTNNNNTNPITNKKCKQSFENRLQDNEEVLMSNDTMDQVYFAGLACIGIYIFYRIMEKSR